MSDMIASSKINYNIKRFIREGHSSNIVKIKFGVDVAIFEPFCGPRQQILIDIDSDQPCRLTQSK